MSDLVDTNAWLSYGGQRAGLDLVIWLVRAQADEIKILRAELARPRGDGQQEERT